MPGASPQSAESVSFSLSPEPEQWSQAYDVSYPTGRSVDQPPLAPHSEFAAGVAGAGAAGVAVGRPGGRAPGQMNTPPGSPAAGTRFGVEALYGKTVTGVSGGGGGGGGTRAPGHMYTPPG